MTLPVPAWLLAIPQKGLGIAKRHAVLLAGIASAVALMIGLTALAWHSTGWLIVADEPPATLDVVFTFAGPKMRVDYSLDVLSRYPNAHWILSDPHGRFTSFLSEKEFGPDRCTILADARNTREELRILFESLNSREGGDSLSLGLISEPFHMRRIKRYAGKLMPLLCRPARVSCLPIPEERLPEKENPYGRWWKDKRLRRFAGEEMWKVMLSFLWQPHIRPCSSFRGKTLSAVVADLGANTSNNDAVGL